MEPKTADELQSEAAQTVRDHPSVATSMNLNDLLLNNQRELRR